MHPLADNGESARSASMPDTYETAGFGWGNAKLALARSDGRIVVSAEWVRWDRTLAENVTVPLGSLAKIMRLAGGDLPGRGSFRMVRGDLAFAFGQHFALELTVSSDEVDGGRAQVWLDIEQVQEMRRLLAAWRLGHGHPCRTNGSNTRPC